MITPRDSVRIKYGRKNNNNEQMIEFIDSHKARNDYQEASLVG